MLSYVLRFHWRKKTRPTRSGIKLGVGTEKIISAADALIKSLVFAVVILSGERLLRPLFPGYLVLFGRENFSPFSIIFVYFVFHIVIAPCPRVGLLKRKIAAVEKRKSNNKIQSGNYNV
jgi:hypothetical protein